MSLMVLSDDKLAALLDNDATVVAADALTLQVVGLLRWNHNKRNRDTLCGVVHVAEETGSVVVTAVLELEVCSLRVFTTVVEEDVSWEQCLVGRVSVKEVYEVAAIPKPYEVSVAVITYAGQPCARKLAAEAVFAEPCVCTWAVIVLVALEVAVEVVWNGLCAGRKLYWIRRVVVAGDVGPVGLLVGIRRVEGEVAVVCQALDVGCLHSVVA